MNKRVLLADHNMSVRTLVREVLIQQAGISPNEIAEEHEFTGAKSTIANKLKEDNGFEVVIMDTYMSGDDDAARLVEYMSQKPRKDGNPYQVIIFSCRIDSEGQFLGRQEVWGRLLDKIANAKRTGAVKVVGKIGKDHDTRFRTLIDLVRKSLNVRVV